MAFVQLGQKGRLMSLFVWYCKCGHDNPRNSNVCGECGRLRETES
jgi:hypothetical protein